LKAKSPVHVSGYRKIDPPVLTNYVGKVEWPATGDLEMLMNCHSRA